MLFFFVFFSYYYYYYFLFLFLNQKIEIMLANKLVFDVFRKKKKEANEQKKIVQESVAYNPYFFHSLPFCLSLYIHIYLYGWLFLLLSFFPHLLLLQFCDIAIYGRKICNYQQPRGKQPNQLILSLLSPSLFQVLLKYLNFCFVYDSKRQTKMRT